MTEETGFFTHPCPKLGQYVKVDTQSLEPSPRVIPIFAKRRAECLIKLVSKTVPNISTASGGGRLATDYNKFTRRCRMAAQTARRSAASYFGPTGLPGQAGGAQAGQPGLARSPLFTHTGDGDTIRPGHVANDYNPPVPPQAGPALRPDGDDVTPDPGL